MGLPKLDEFAARHADVREQVAAWVAEVRDATWSNPHDVRQRYATVSFLRGGRTVFNLKGNDYRLGAKINYKAQIVLVLQIGTHAEYDDWEW